MLDRDNLLISMGPPEVNRDMGNTASHSYCLLVYSLVEVTASGQTIESALLKTRICSMVE